MNKRQKDKLKQQILEASAKVEDDLRSGSKWAARNLHQPATNQARKAGNKWIKENLRKYWPYFANGKEVMPNLVQPILVEVVDQWHQDLFRLARYYWSLPYTKGYGRRLKFLVMDGSNNSLIGILGLQSPPLDFSIRDNLFHYPEGEKVLKVNQMMDIYTLGAIPPYNRLLGGKLIALAATANEVRKAYTNKYRNTKTVLENQHIPARLIGLTTTSAYGRSSIYNRLKFKGESVAISLGYTQGFGSFHLSTLYPQLREFLEQQGISTKGGYGAGPRIVWSTCSRALTELGLSPRYLKHGIKREGFFFPIAKNYKSYLEGRAERPEYYNRPFEELAEWWRERWMLQRAERVDGWHKWRKYNLAKSLYKVENNAK